MTNESKFLNCITLTQSQKVIGNSAKRFTLQTKQSQVINSDKLFWDAVIHTLPLDPPKSLNSYVLDSLADSLFGGLVGLGTDKVDILWPFADNISRRFLTDKVEFFHDVAADVRDSDERSVTLRLFLICSNENNRKALEAEFLFLK